MNKGFGKDGYTKFLQAKMEDYGLTRIWDLEDTMEQKTAEEIIAYLRDSQCTATIGIFLRRYICGKFCEETSDGYVYHFDNGESCHLTNYMSPQYDLTKELPEYVSIFEDIRQKYNSDMAFRREEARRLLKMDGICSREKLLFELSFALHMEAMDVHKFLVDCLAEQTFNFRVWEEVILFYCLSHPEENTYARFQDLCQKYTAISNTFLEGQAKANYTRVAKEIVTTMIDTEEELLQFLANNIVEFTGWSNTAYEEFTAMLDEIMEQAEVANYEQLAKVLLACIPRATFVRQRKNGILCENEFVPINNEHSAEGEEVVTLLPKCITNKLLKKERIEKILSKKINVERKDLIFLRFYILYLQCAGKEYTELDRVEFVAETNAMLLRCGMSPLYVANRFENLLLLCLYCAIPWEQYECVVEASFFNEPKATE